MSKKESLAFDDLKVGMIIYKNKDTVSSGDRQKITRKNKETFYSHTIENGKELNYSNKVERVWWERSLHDVYKIDYEYMDRLEVELAIKETFNGT
jgi:hypothetical protein